MRPRDPAEPHRVATALELLFDLTFVVAVARVAAELAHSIEDNDVRHGTIGYLMVFFAIWWAWMNFTWFASAYDCDDAFYRVVTLLQMAGVLVLAAGVPAAFDEQDFKTITVGYLIMRVAMVIQWLRAARADPVRRNTNLGYAAGIAIVQVGWLARLALPEDQSEGMVIAVFLLLVAAEIAVPWLTEKQGMTPWHPHHIAERYGLFTIIVLGESVTAASIAMSSTFDADGVTGDLVMLAPGGLILLFGMWWLYFVHDTGEALEERRHLSFVWGYSHYFVAAGAAAVGASLEAAAAVSAHHGEELAHGAEEGVSGRTVALVVAVAVSMFLLISSTIHGRLTDGHVPGFVESASTATALVAVSYFVGNDSIALAVMLQGLLLAGLVAVTVSRDRVTVPA